MKRLFFVSIFALSVFTVFAQNFNNDYSYKADIEVSYTANEYHLSTYNSDTKCIDDLEVRSMTVHQEGFKYNYDTKELVLLKNNNEYKKYFNIYIEKHTYNDKTIYYLFNYNNNNYELIRAQVVMRTGIGYSAFIK